MVHLILVVLLMVVVMLIVLITQMMLVITNIMSILDHIHILAPCVDHLILRGGCSWPMAGANILTCFQGHPTISATGPSSSGTPPVRVLLQNSICNTLLSTVLCLRHSTTLRSCYCYLNRPCLITTSSRPQYSLNYLEIIWKYSENY